jgi:hypothetical protein
MQLVETSITIMESGEASTTSSGMVVKGVRLMRNLLSRCLDGALKDQ